MKDAKRKNMPQKTDTGKSGVQGEGDYDAARRHRQSVEDFLESNDPEQLARSAAPADPQEGEELEDAEKRGRDGPGDDARQETAPRDRPGQARKR
jgi:hypothetical protein